MIEEMPSGQEKFISSPGFVLSFRNVVGFVVKVVVVVVVAVVVVGVVLVGVVVVGVVVEFLIDAKSNNNYSYYALSVTEKSICKITFIKIFRTFSST